MPIRRFGKHARMVVAAAMREEANGERRGLIEAEHLLLALADTPQLKYIGLDHEELAAAFEREEEQSLAAVGVSADDLPPANFPRAGTPRLATSAKLAIERAMKLTAKRGQRQMSPEVLLLGVISAEHGRVPRALQLADVDIDELRARV
jgi:ATP-dependent Clp protease ATP-binding subunit ClpA